MDSTLRLLQLLLLNVKACLLPAAAPEAIPIASKPTLSTAHATAHIWRLCSDSYGLGFQYWRLRCRWQETPHQMEHAHPVICLLEELCPLCYFAGISIFMFCPANAVLSAVQRRLPLQHILGAVGASLGC